MMGNDNHNYNMARILQHMGITKRRPTRKRFNPAKRKRTRTTAKKNTKNNEKMQQYNEQDKRYLKEPIEHWEQATNKNIKEWPVMAEKLVEKSKERATTKVLRNQPRITSHFTRITETEPQERRGKPYNRRPPRKPPHEC